MIDDELNDAVFAVLSGPTATKAAAAINDFTRAVIREGEARRKWRLQFLQDLNSFMGMTDDEFRESQRVLAASRRLERRRRSSRERLAAVARRCNTR